MNPYDEILYPGRPFAQTHPDRLATIGRLFGMQPAPVERCRVLELGCGDGGNLIPMAYTLPDSEFVGVDLGARGIEKGRETIAALGLANIRLECLDILQAGADLGEFDYIVSHGVYSWVPEAVQEKLLEISGRNLKPQGVAYVSYTVYPGAHLRNMLAEMLKYHANRFAAPAEKIEQTRVMLGFLAEAKAEVRREAEALAGRGAAALFHDELCEVQSPVYFHEFASRAGRHGLQYLGEADFFEMVDRLASPESTAMLRSVARNAIEKEQYMDFLKCRRFRQTLLCRAEIGLQRRLDSARVREFYVSARHARDTEPMKALTDHPVAQAALDVMADAWPGALSFDELKRSTGADDEEALCDIVLGFYSCSTFQLHVRAPRFAGTAGERPRASMVARVQAKTDPVVTNLCHHAVRLEDELGMKLLCALDGTRDRAALMHAMREAVGAEREATLDEDLERSLNGLARLALLEG